MKPHDKGKLLVISGPSGAGKSTVIGKLMELRDDLCFSVSVTTRQPRPGEVDGRDYFFVTPQHFQELTEGGYLLEHAEYVGNRYGTPRGYVVVNDDPEAAAREVNAILTAEKCRAADRINLVTEVLIS